MHDTNKQLADPNCPLCEGHGSQTRDNEYDVRVCQCVIEERRRRIEEAKERSRRNGGA